MVVLLCLFQGLVAGLLRPRPSLKQIEQSSSSGKFRERHSNQQEIVSLLGCSIILRNYFGKFYFLKCLYLVRYESVIIQ
jgi:hypothetical protein